MSALLIQEALVPTLCAAAEHARREWADAALSGSGDTDYADMAWAAAAILDDLATTGAVVRVPEPERKHQRIMLWMLVEDLGRDARSSGDWLGAVHWTRLAYELATFHGFDEVWGAA